MPFSHLPALLTRAFAALAHWLDRRSAARVPLLLVGLLFARGRRTVTAWFRAAGIADSTLHTVRPLLGPGRMAVAIDDTPTARYGPCVEGCGLHHNPSPGPA